MIATLHAHLPRTAQPVKSLRADEGAAYILPEPAIIQPRCWLSSKRASLIKQLSNVALWLGHSICKVIQTRCKLTQHNPKQWSLLMMLCCPFEIASATDSKAHIVRYASVKIAIA